MTHSARRDEDGPERELSDEVLSDPSAYAAHLAQFGLGEPVAFDRARLRSLADHASSWKPDVERGVALAELSEPAGADRFRPLA